MPFPLEPFSQNSRPLKDFVQLGAAHEYIGQGAVWGIVHPPAKLQLLLIETDKVMSRRILHRVVVLKIGLQHNFSRSVPAPRASRHLGEQLKRSLGGAKVRHAQRAVGSDHAYE